MLVELIVFSIFKFNFNFTEVLFYRIKLNIYGFHVINKETME